VVVIGELGLKLGGVGVWEVRFVCLDDGEPHTVLSCSFC